MDRLKKLSTLRSLIAEYRIDYLVIPSNGPDISDQVQEHWKIIKWLTGFTGSYAFVVVSQSFAGLWTDSRYYIQAEKQLAGSGFKLMLPENFQSSDHAGWLSDNIKQGDTIGFDGRLVSVTDFRKIKNKFGNRSVRYVTDLDLFTTLWTDRPVMPESVVRDHSIKYAGKDRRQKLAEVREKMKKKSVDAHLLTSPEDIMWLLNIRGNDLEFNPVALSYFLLSERSAVLFASIGKISEELLEEFAQLKIEIKNNNTLTEVLSSLKAVSSVLLSPDTTSTALYNSIPEHLIIVEDVSIPGRMKAVKNHIEIKNIEHVMIRDGIALTKFFYWLENNTGKMKMTESSLAFKLREFRTEQPDYIGPSFRTISAYNANAALPHYETDPVYSSIISGNGIFLIDSGAQYHGGTTDITRTIIIGNPLPEQKRDFTLVLKGHIALASAKFPAGTKGYQLDILARQYLWEAGLNYGHGTGHGVGFCLNVHEGPQSISPAANCTSIEAGMLISNEPAVYREGLYGIRTENLMICYEDEETEFGKFLKFDTVSLCYIDRNLIEQDLLSRQETEWLNKYHEELYTKIAPYLESREKAWLRLKTNPF